MSRTTTNLFFWLLFILNFCLFYNYFYLFDGKHYDSDFPFHIGQLKHFLQNPRLYYEPGLQILGNLFSKLLLVNTEIGGILFLAIVHTLIPYIYFRFFYSDINNERSAVFFTFVMFFSAAIHFPLINKPFFVGIGAPTVWHNPTTMIVKPVGIFTVYLAAQYFDSIMNIKKGLFLSSLLLLSTFLKPSFSEVFIPALTVYGFIFYPKNIRYISRWLLVVAPTVIMLLIQFAILKYAGSQIALAPGLVLHSFVKNIPVAFLQACAFPLAILFYRRPWQNKPLMLSWIFTLLAYAQFFLLAEMPRYLHGNFGWSYLLGISFVFLFSMIELIQWLKEENITHIRDLPQATRNLKITSMIVFLHLASGLFWFVKIYLGGAYY